MERELKGYTEMDSPPEYYHYLRDGDRSIAYEVARALIIVPHLKFAYDWKFRGPRLDTVYYSMRGQPGAIYHRYWLEVPLKIRLEERYGT